MTTLNGGKDINVILESGETETATVRQLPLRDYDKAFNVQDDEFALAALVCVKPKEWVQSLSPESFELLRTTVEEVNSGSFFVYAQRQQDKLVKRLNSVSPEILRMAAEKVFAPSHPGLRPQ